jgi:hypothetical protein
MGARFNENGDRTDLVHDYHGVVYANADPQGLGRIRATLDGVADNPATGWLLPLGMGAGSGPAGGTGVWAIPAVGSEIVARFYLGNPDEGYWIGGNWRSADVPPETLGGSPDVLLVAAKNFAVVLDDGTGTATIRDRRTGTGVKLSREGLRLDIDAVADISITAGGSISIDAPQVTINGRVVLTGGPVE